MRGDVQQRVRLAGCLLSLGLLALLQGTGEAQKRQLSPALAPYLSCRSVAGATLVQTTPLIAAPSKRAVQTLVGDRQIDILDGARLSYTMNGVDYALMRVEELPLATYLQGRGDLISNFKRLISGDELAFPEDTLPPTLQGFQINGSNHREMLGEALGLYLLIDEKTRVAVTIYFQNAEQASRTFHDMAEYGAMRDAFLNGYVGCVRAAQRK